MAARGGLWLWLMMGLPTLPLIYAASFGPACWLACRYPAALFEPVIHTYRPLGKAAWLCPGEYALEGLRRYGTLEPGNAGPDVALFVLWNARPVSIDEPQPAP